MKYDFFVSGRWRNKKEVLRLAEAIRNKKYSAYCFLDHISSSENVQSFEKLDWRTDQYVRKVFEQDMNAQRSSDVFVMLLPAGKSCHMEAGVSYGLGKKCILIGKQEEAESLYLLFDESYDTIDEFLQLLSSKDI